ncbi:hypothetical protein BCR44DRAFT_1429255 [Catenaria anguillulae PL171]|uniref:Uncharacterized protein n=1 Tax=Catenaria anguillulae PL171 TaxID=765915 RepID=A0A1Y2HTS9_9FUNG|nr:hypothetical protein BCR44DRAFT_1429255 [Catenaria anguillulae PL171]
MLAADEQHDSVAINTKHPLSLVTSSAPAALDPDTRTVILQNVRPGVSPTDLLALARHCTSLSAIYYPPVDLKSDRVGRTAMFFSDDKLEARGFFEYIKKLIRDGKGQMRKMYEVRAADEMKARTRRGKAGGAFATWLVRMKVMLGGLSGSNREDDGEDHASEASEEEDFNWMASAGGKAGSSMFAKDVWGG